MGGARVPVDFGWVGPWTSGGLDFWWVEPVFLWTSGGWGPCSRAHVPVDFGWVGPVLQVGGAHVPVDFGWVSGGTERRVCGSSPLSLQPSAISATIG